MILRATSDIAVAITVGRLPFSPISLAISRPASRAFTTSASELMSTLTSSASLTRLNSSRLEIQLCKTLFEIQCGRNPFQCEAKLYHRECNFGLDADDHGLRPPQSDHVGESAQSLRSKGVHDVERCDVDNNAAGAEFPHAVRQFIPKLKEILIGESRLNGRDEVTALFEDRNSHPVRLSLLAARFRTPASGYRCFQAFPARPCNRAAVLLPRFPPANRRRCSFSRGRLRSSRGSERSPRRAPLR